MPNVKKIVFDSPEGTGLSLECSVMREIDDYYMDAADGLFKVLPIADIWISMIESVNDLGRYILSESRAIWLDGSHIIAIRNAATVKRVGSGIMYIRKDKEISLLDSIDAELGKRVLDPVAKTITYYRRDGVTLMEDFDLETVITPILPIVSRIPK